MAKKSISQNTIRTLALKVLIIGSVGSFGLMLYTGRHNSSVILLSLFAIWVLSPFIGLIVLNWISARWGDMLRTTLSILIICITVVSLLGYSGLLKPPGVKPAFVFLIVPLVSWLLIGIFIALSHFISRRFPEQKDKE
jgi:ABC-type enterochelin transport system permease subunit